MSDISVRAKKFSLKQLLIYTAIIYTAFVFLLYGAFVLYRSVRFYKSLKHMQRGLIGSVYRADPELGFAPVPGAQGAHILKPLPDVPIHYDLDGFRIPADYASGDAPRRRPLVLALGCSYTYGDACRAEDTFTWLVGKQRGGSSINAGGCGYGLAQMLIRARKLIPAFHPDYVLLQYSPWLADRSQSYFAPSFYGKVTNPFFYMQKGQVKTGLPVFTPIVFSLPFDEYKKSPASALDLLSFIVRAGIPLHVYEDVQMTRFQARRVLGLVPPAATDTAAIVESAYGEIARIADENDCRVIVVVLGDTEKPVPVPQEIRALGLPIANACEALMSTLPERTLEAYARSYVHWGGNPPIVVDAHPNAAAHRVIAHAIVSRLRAEDILAQ